MRLPPFQRLLDSHRDEVHRFLVATAGPQEADDCFQETVLSALRAYPRLRSADNLRAWLLTIAHRKAIDAHRARGRRAVPTPDSALEAGIGAGPAGGGEPELWQRVRELPPKQRAAVVLRFVLDLRHAQAAEVMGCSEDAARRSLHEALSTLRKDWKR
ncbi:MAG: RNA polymerase sigma factor [Actinomycetota bacterium]|nr:RNA polymerase sigma factor [Actinomycetota bacterium]